MSAATKITYTCDRCGEQVENADTNWQPSSWGAFIEVTPPKAGLDVDSVLRYMLCPSCMRYVRRTITDMPRSSDEAVA